MGYCKDVTKRNSDGQVLINRSLAGLGESAARQRKMDLSQCTWESEVYGIRTMYATVCLFAYGSLKIMVSAGWFEPDMWIGWKILSSQKEIGQQVEKHLYLCSGWY